MGRDRLLDVADAAPHSDDDGASIEAAGRRSSSRRGPARGCNTPLGEDGLMPPSPGCTPEACADRALQRTTELDSRTGGLPEQVLGTGELLKIGDRSLGRDLRQRRNGAATTGEMRQRLVPLLHLGLEVGQRISAVELQHR